MSKGKPCSVSFRNRAASLFFRTPHHWRAILRNQDLATKRESFLEEERSHPYSRSHQSLLLEWFPRFHFCQEVERPQHRTQGEALTNPRLRHAPMRALDLPSFVELVRLGGIWVIPDQEGAGVVTDRLGLGSTGPNRFRSSQ